MRQKAHGQVRRSQVITTYGPGALIDLPQESAIVAGLDEWPPPHKLEEVDEPRLARKLQAITGVATPRLLAPPAASSDPGAAPIGIGARVGGQSLPGGWTNRRQRGAASRAGSWCERRPTPGSRRW